VTTLPTTQSRDIPRSRDDVDRLLARLRRMLSASRPTGEWWWQLARELAALENAVWQLRGSGTDQGAYGLTMRIATVRTQVDAQPRRAGDVIAAVAGVLDRVESALARGTVAA
jgi:hypothetical protein